ncbi:MAG TPA: murein biosynthesis integral membrane protein MurJ [Clostridia bacterium]|nr:murein biosynthesis integral membrane protein MurJ [Clostridia bacterium]
MASHVTIGKGSVVASSALRLLRPTHEHSSLSATILLAGSVIVSRVLGAVRDAYVAWAFGAGATTDAFVAAFTLPDLVNYLLAGSTASIALISILTRYKAEKREHEAQGAFSAIVTIVSVIVTILIVIAAVFAHPIIRVLCPRFTPDQLELCVRLTRILLPVQAFFIVGGIVSATLQVRRRFLYPALVPVVFNLGIIAGGVLLSGRYGISGLAYGAVIGAFSGAILLNVIGARRAGVSFRPSFQFRNPAFIEWLKLTIPLMIGASLVVFDDPFTRHFASGGAGDITRINYAKRMFVVPAAVIGQAAGQAYLPLFAKLFNETKRKEFGEVVNTVVSRAAMFSLLAGSWLFCAALPCVDLIFRLVRGHFQFADSQKTAVLLACFSFALVFWSVQGFYARAFYAAGDTLTPMLVGTAIAAASFPIYGFMFQKMGIVGLPLASNFAMFLYAATLATLLNRRKMVPLLAVNRIEIAKVAVAAVGSGVVGTTVALLVPPHGSRLDDVKSLAFTSIAWAISAVALLVVMKSTLFVDIRKMLRRVSS